MTNTKKHDKASMAAAVAVSEDSYCKKRKVGAVVTRDGRIVASGYNGTSKGDSNKCEEITLRCDNCGVISNDDILICENCNNGEMVEKLITKDNVIHAEANLVCFSSRYGIPLDGCVLYVNTSPCVGCANLIIGAGIKEVVYLEEYKNIDGVALLRRNKIVVRKYEI